MELEDCYSQFSETYVQFYYVGTNPCTHTHTHAHTNIYI